MKPPMPRRMRRLTRPNRARAVWLGVLAMSIACCAQARPLPADPISTDAEKQSQDHDRAASDADRAHEDVERARTQAAAAKVELDEFIARHFEDLRIRALAPHPPRQSPPALSLPQMPD